MFFRSSIAGINDYFAHLSSLLRTGFLFDSIVNAQALRKAQRLGRFIRKTLQKSRNYVRKKARCYMYKRSIFSIELP